MMEDISNITKQVLYEEVIQGIKGLAYECSLLCKEIGLRGQLTMKMIKIKSRICFLMLINKDKEKVKMTFFKIM